MGVQLCSDPWVGTTGTFLGPSFSLLDYFAYPNLHRTPITPSTAIQSLSTVVHHPHPSIVLSNNTVPLSAIFRSTWPPLIRIRV